MNFFSYVIFFPSRKKKQKRQAENASSVAHILARQRTHRISILLKIFRQGKKI